MNIQNIVSLKLQDISSMAKTLEQADEISKRKNGVEAKLVISEKRRSIVVGTEETQAGKDANRVSREAVYLGLCKSNSLSGESLMSARAILLGKGYGADHELCAKPLTSRTFKQLELAISLGERGEGGYDDFNKTVEEFADAAANEFAAKFTANIYGTLNERLKDDFVDVAVRLCREKGPGVMQPVDDFCRMVENRVYAKNASLFAALDKAEAFIKDSPVEGFIDRMVGGLKLPPSAQDELKRRYLSMMKEEVVRKIQQNDFDVDHPLKVQREVMNSLTRFNAIMRGASNEFESIMSAARNAEPALLSETVLLALEEKLANRIQQALTKKAEKDSTFDDIAARKLIHGFQADNGLIPEAREQIDKFRSAARQIMGVLQEMLDCIPVAMRPMNFAAIEKQVGAAVQAKLRDWVWNVKGDSSKDADIAKSVTQAVKDEFQALFRNPELFNGLKESADEILDLVTYGDKEPKTTLSQFVTGLPHLKDNLVSFVRKHYEQRLSEHFKDRIDVNEEQRLATATLQDALKPLFADYEKLLSAKKSIVHDLGIDLAEDSKLRKQIEAAYEELVVQQLDASDAEGFSLKFKGMKLVSPDSLYTAFKDVLERKFLVQILYLKEASFVTKAEPAPKDGPGRLSVKGSRVYKDNSELLGNFKFGQDRAEAMIGKFRTKRMAEVKNSLQNAYTADAKYLEESISKETMSKLQPSLQTKLSAVSKNCARFKGNTQRTDGECISVLCNVRGNQVEDRAYALKFRLLGTIMLENLTFEATWGNVLGADKANFVREMGKFSVALKRLLAAPISPGNPAEPVYCDYFDAYHLRVDRLLTAPTEECRELLNALRTAIKPLDIKPVADISSEEIRAIITATKKLTEYLDDEISRASQQAYEEVKHAADSSQKRMWTLLECFGTKDELDFSTIATRLSTLGITLEEAKLMSDEDLKHWANVRSAYTHVTNPADANFKDLLARLKDGSLPLSDMTYNRAGLVKCLLRGAASKRSDVHGRGFNTLDAKIVFTALMKNGLFSDRLEKLSKNAVVELGNTLSCLYPLNNDKTDGIAILGEQLLGMDIFTFAEKVAAKDDSALRLMTALKSGSIANPLDGLVGTEKRILDFFKTSASAVEFFTETGKAGLDVSPTALLAALRNLEKKAVASKPGEVVTSDFRFGDKPVRLEVKDGSFRAVFRLGDRECPLGCPFDVGAFADRLAKEIVGNVAVFGVGKAREVLKKSLGEGRVIPTKMAYIKTRDLALTVLETLAKTPVAKLSHLSSEQVCKLADRILEMYTDGDDVTVLTQEVAKVLSADNTRFNSAEVMELCAEVEKVAAAEVDKVVVLPPAMKTPLQSANPLREFAAELFQGLQSWKDDRQVLSQTERLAALFSERADIVSRLSASPAALDDAFSFGVGDYRDTSLAAAVKQVLASLRVACGKKDVNAPLDATEIRTALVSDKFKRDLITLQSDLSQAVKSCAESLQKLFSEQFAAKLANSMPAGDSIEMLTLRQLAGADSFDVTSGYGMFLKKSFERYFSELKGADRNAFLASILRQTGPGDDLKAVMTAMVKAAGPVFQKLVQGVPEHALPAELRSVVACSKSSLAPIAPEVVRAKLYSLVQRSNGRIQSIEVKQSLGAASVGEAFLCVIKTKDNPFGEECVVKMLRPDVQPRSQREYEILAAIAGSVDETGSMKTAFDARFEGILEELDFMQEAKNIALGSVYSGVSKSFTSMATHSLVSPTSDMLILAKAEGTTYDRYVSSVNTMVDAIGDRFKTTVTDPETGKVTSISYTRNTVVEAFKAKHELIAVYDDLLKRQKALVKFSRRWTEEAIFNSGIFHGDLHGGNIMTSKDLLTAIDFGNVSKLTEKQRDSLMGIIAACAVNSPTCVVDYYKKLLSPAGLQRLATAQGKKDFEQFAKNVKAILAKGGMTDAPLRLSAVIRQLDKFGFEVPAPLFNFSQSLTRLEDTIVSVNVTLQRIKAMYTDICPDLSPYDKYGISSTNPFDYSAALLKNIEEDVPEIIKGKKKLHNLVGGFSSRMQSMGVDPALKPKDSDAPITFKAKMLEHLGSQEQFDHMLDLLDDVLFPIDVATGKRTESVRTNPSYSAFINAFLNSPNCFTNLKAKEEFVNDIAPNFVTGFSQLNAYMIYNAVIHSFPDPSDYGKMLKDLVFDHQVDIEDRASAALFGGALSFSMGSGLATSERIKNDLAKVDDAADKWVDSKQRITHMDAERVKVAVRELLTFSDSDFVYNGALFIKYHWSNDSTKRASFLKKLDANLKWLDTRLPQLGFPAGDGEYEQAVRDFAIYYMGQRNGIGLSFGTRSENSYENMTPGLYNQLLAEAENGVKAGKLDRRVIDVLKSWRADATAEPAPES